MSTREKFLAATVVIFFVCLVVWVVRTTPTAPPPIEKVAPPTVMEYEGNTLTEEKDGKILWELSCDKMRVDSLTQDMELINVRGKFYDDEDVWDLTAKRAIYDRTENIIYVEGEVVVTNSDNEKLLSDELIWYTEEEMLTASGNVSVTKDDGSELKSDELTWLAAKETLMATGKVRVKDNEGAKLASDKLEWFTAEEKVIATGNVRISNEDMRAFGDLAYSENNFKNFGLLGHARILKGVKDDEEAF